MSPEENSNSSQATEMAPEAPTEPVAIEHEVSAASPTEPVAEPKPLESGEIGDLLAGIGQLTGISPGQIVRGTVLKVTDEEVIVDIGLKSEGAISRGEFLAEDGRLTVQAGDTVDVWIEEYDEQEGTFTVSHRKAARLRTWEDLERAFREQTNVKGRAVAWLWELARVLEASDVVGVSCAEYPRQDSDLFYQLLIWNHYRSLQLDRDRTLQWDSSCTSPAGLRANAQLSGISFLIRRETFEKYRYAGDYAEDLELGIRLIKDGHKIASLYSTRVLHSHNRPAFYFLKRGYVDVKNLDRVMPGFTYPEIRDQRRVFEDMATLYGRLNSLPLELTNGADRLRVTDYMAKLGAGIGSSNGSPHAQSADRNLDQFLRDRASSQAAYEPRTNMILPHVMQHLALLEQFLSRVEEDVDEALAAAIQECVIKIFALHSGTHLGYLYLSQSVAEMTSPDVTELDRELVRGV